MCPEPDPPFFSFCCCNPQCNTFWVFKVLREILSSSLWVNFGNGSRQQLAFETKHWKMYVKQCHICALFQWVFMQMNPSWSGNGEQLHRDSNDFFRRLAQGRSRSSAWRKYCCLGFDCKSFITAGFCHLIPEAQGFDNDGVVPWQIVYCEPCLEGKNYSSSVFLIPCYFYFFKFSQGIRRS